MLLSEPTKYGSGITIWGDYQDLENLHETIHFLAEGVPLTIHFMDIMLGLAYDVRHAFQGDRKTKISGFDRLDRVKYYGVDILWPIFLVQLGLMRWSAGFHTTTREHQANLFRLEYCAEYALMKYDSETGKKCFDWLIRFSGFPNDYLLEYINESTRIWISSSRVEKSRFRLLPDVLEDEDHHVAGISNF